MLSTQRARVVSRYATYTSAIPIRKANLTLNRYILKWSLVWQFLFLLENTKRWQEVFQTSRQNKLSKLSSGSVPYHILRRDTYGTLLPQSLKIIFQKYDSKLASHLSSPLTKLNDRLPFCIDMKQYWHCFLKVINSCSPMTSKQRYS